MKEMTMRTQASKKTHSMCTKQNETKLKKNKNTEMTMLTQASKKHSNVHKKQNKNKTRNKQEQK